MNIRVKSPRGTSIFHAAQLPQTNNLTPPVFSQEPAQSPIDIDISYEEDSIQHSHENDIQGLKVATGQEEDAPQSKMRLSFAKVRKSYEGPGQKNEQMKQETLQTLDTQTSLSSGNRRIKQLIQKEGEGEQSGKVIFHDEMMEQEKIQNDHNQEKVLMLQHEINALKGSYQKLKKLGIIFLIVMGIVILFQIASHL